MCQGAIRSGACPGRTLGRVVSPRRGRHAKTRSQSGCISVFWLASRESRGLRTLREHPPRSRCAHACCRPATGVRCCLEACLLGRIGRHDRLYVRQQRHSSSASFRFGKPTGCVAAGNPPERRGSWCYICKHAGLKAQCADAHRATTEVDSRQADCHSCMRPVPPQNSRDSTPWCNNANSQHPCRELLLASLKLSDL